MLSKVSTAVLDKVVADHTQRELEKLRKYLQSQSQQVDNLFPSRPELHRFIAGEYRGVPRRDNYDDSENGVNGVGAGGSSAGSKMISILSKIVKFSVVAGIVVAAFLLVQYFFETYFV